MDLIFCSALVLLKTQPAPCLDCQALSGLALALWSMKLSLLP